MAKRTKPHSEMLMSYLRDREAAVAYLNAALEEGEEVFLQALREVAMANELPMSRIASEASVSRENLYRMTSATGNPTLENLTGLLRALGLRIEVRAAEKVSK